MREFALFRLDSANQWLWRRCECADDQRIPLTPKAYQVTRDSGGWKLAVPLEKIELEVPETLRQAIEAQIELLSIEEQHALEVASVAGQSFSALALANATGSSRERLLELFGALCRKSRFLRPGPYQPWEDGAMVQVFEIVHALYREVFYWRQTPARRESLRRALGAS